MTQYRWERHVAALPDPQSKQALLWQLWTENQERTAALYERMRAITRVDAESVALTQEFADVTEEGAAITQAMVETPNA
jgi:hypothetical protein